MYMMGGADEQNIYGDLHVLEIGMKITFSSSERICRADEMVNDSIGWRSSRRKVWAFFALDIAKSADFVWGICE